MDSISKDGKISKNRIYTKKINIAKIMLEALKKFVQKKPSKENFTENFFDRKCEEFFLIC